MLGRIGTEDARQALIAALTGKDKDLAAVAAGALGQVGLTDSGQDRAARRRAETTRRSRCR